MAATKKKSPSKTSKSSAVKRRAAPEVIVDRGYTEADFERLLVDSFPLSSALRRHNGGVDVVVTTPGGRVFTADFKQHEGRAKNRLVAPSEARAAATERLAVEAKSDAARDVASDRADRALSLLGALVPKRIADEEVGDALEAIGQMRRERRPAWWVYAKVIATYLFVALHAVHYRMQNAPKKRRAASSKRAG